MTTNLDNIAPETLATIQKAISVSLAGRRPEPGTHAVQNVVTFEVSGEVRVSEDSERTPTTSVPLKATLALFMKYAGVTGPAALAALERAMREAIEADRKGAVTVAEVADLEAVEAKVVASMQALPKVPKKGAVSVKKGFAVKAVAL